jgi:pyridoxamine 5'-phosphate oxidase
MDLAAHRRDYESHGLEPADVLADPIAQMRRWLEEASTAGLSEPGGMVVCTVDADGRPSARIVLLRVLDERGFGFFTNYDSAKGHDLAGQPYAALCFDWTPLHRQVRVRGPVTKLPEPESDAYFAGRPRGSQIGAWASPQSAVIGDRSQLDRAVTDAAARFGDDEPVPRPANWGGYLVRPDEMELWQGRASRLHDRLRYRRTPDGDWLLERLAP